MLQSAVFSPRNRIGRELDGRGDGIWTHDLCVPNAALYQTEPRLDNKIYYTTTARECQGGFYKKVCELWKSLDKQLFGWYNTNIAAFPSRLHRGGNGSSEEPRGGGLRSVSFRRIALNVGINKRFPL